MEVSIAPGAERLLVPHLVLQPLVENAVRHGMEPKADPGTIRLEATVGSGSLRLEVTDDGVGSMRLSRRQGAGVGLANVRARLARLYGEEARLECGDRPEGDAVDAIRRERPDVVLLDVQMPVFVGRNDPADVQSNRDVIVRPGRLERLRRGASRPADRVGSRRHGGDCRRALRERTRPAARRRGGQPGAALPQPGRRSLTHDVIRHRLGW